MLSRGLVHNDQSEGTFLDMERTQVENEANDPLVRIDQRDGLHGDKFLLLQNDRLGELEIIVVELNDRYVQCVSIQQQQTNHVSILDFITLLIIVIIKV